MCNCPICCVWPCVVWRLRSCRSRAVLRQLTGMHLACGAARAGVEPPQWWRRRGRTDSVDLKVTPTIHHHPPLPHCVVVLVKLYSYIASPCVWFGQNAPCSQPMRGEACHTRSQRLWSRPCRSSVCQQARFTKGSIRHDVC